MSVLKTLKNLGPAIERALVGVEKLAPEAEHQIRKYVASNGFINHEALGERKLLGDLLLGKPKALAAIRGRYAQGGLVGKGGVITGEFAFDPRFKEMVSEVAKAHRGGHKTVVDPFTGELLSTGKATRRVIGKAIGQSVNPLMLLGFPVMDIKDALGEDPSEDSGGMSGILRGLGSGIGFAATAPLGLVGGIAGSHILGELGAGIGSRFDPKKSETSTDTPVANPYINTNLLDAALPAQYTSM